MNGQAYQALSGSNPGKGQVSCSLSHCLWSFGSIHVRSGVPLALVYFGFWILVGGGLKRSFGVDFSPQTWSGFGSNGFGLIIIRNRDWFLFGIRVGLRCFKLPNESFFKIWPV